ncbi:hypothetical protein KEM56_002694 [Ascosphaera pollenicola]|nr:hypothetical protein KEM56_002694 [Ascosphaera pollenicola]
MVFLLEKLARLLDNPSIPWKPLLIGFSIGHFALESYLSYRQYKCLCEKKPPKALEAEISQEKFDKTQEYGRAKARFGFVSSLWENVQNLSILYYDGFPKMWSIAGLVVSRYFPVWFSGEIGQSLVFMFIQHVVSLVLNLPTSYYSTFVLEEKFGFNKQTVSLWASDIVKSQLLMIVFGAPIVSGLLKIIMSSGPSFFYYLWLFAVFVQVAGITIYPILIQPLFNTLSPMEPGPLKAGVEALAAKLKFPLQGLYVIDGSKRSSHSNAYFYGLPWKKHIVIYDTLIEKSEPEEVIAVLGHELGHWKLNHTSKMLAIAQCHVLFIFALFSAFVNNKSLYAAFGFHDERPILIGLSLFNEALTPTNSLITLGMNSLTRKYEYQADAFAAKLGYADELASGLIKLQLQNLAGLIADWMFSSYHHSHPILLERLTALGWKGTGAAKKQEKDEKPTATSTDREL